MHGLRWITVVQTALLLAVPALAQFKGQQRARPETRSAPETRMAGEFQLSGAVVDASTGEPVRKAAIRIHGGGADPADGVTMTDAGGGFTFRGLEAGTYTLYAEKPGYSTESNPDHRVSQNATVGPGREVPVLHYKMRRQGVLTGKVRDENSDPLPNVLVQVFRKQVREGRREWEPAGGLSTNDVGEYRITVPPGAYLISASHNNQTFYRPRGRRIGDDRPAGAYPTVYYPNVTDTQSAVPVAIASGQEQHADFNLTPTPMFQVRGRLTNMTPQRGVGLNLVPAQSDVTVRRIPANFEGGDGAFYFSGVTPGTYQLLADSFAGPEEHLAARQTITVGANDLAGLEITLAPVFDVAVRVRTDDGSPAPAMHVFLTSDTSHQTFPMGPDKQGAWVIPGLAPGAYRLGATAVSNAYVKSATLSGIDILDRSMEWNGPAGPVEITISTKGGTLSGHIGKSGEAVGAADVVVLRGTPDGQYALARLMHPTGADFTASGLAPGNYLVLAAEDAQNLEYADAGVLRQYQDYTQTVSIEDKGEQHLQLQLAPAL